MINGLWGLPMKRKNERQRKCQTCGKAMLRRRFGARLEDMSRFKARKFCSLRCANIRKNPGRQGRLWRARQMKGKHCEACGILKRLQVHHTDGNITNLSPKNLQTLCIWCHRFVHHTAQRLGRTVPGKLASPVWRTE